ncbi:MAG TPA: ATPase [Bacteroidetes bacterium]|nr:ATPase [Bacteroidota bacterium]
MITRALEKHITGRLNQKKAILLMGARQTGKTTLLRSLFKNKDELLWLNGDEPDVQQLFASISSTRLKQLIGEKKILVIDEAQRIADIGLRLKLITDEIPDIQLIATGSSSFDLTNKVNEPLTGRKWEYTMFPLSFSELVGHHGLLEEKRLIPHRMVFGSYPDVVMNPGNEKEILKQLSDSYLYKDVLMWENIQKPDKLVTLLQALAYQVGNQSSNNELAQICGLDSKTIEKYLTLLEQAFVIFRLGSFRRNLREELKQSRKIYFYDNGIRNAIIADFKQVENRNDVGALWENYIVSERIKFLHNSRRWSNYWYWRTKTQKEIDFIEEADGQLSAYEFKWNEKAKTKYPKQFMEAYPQSTYKIIHPGCIEDFVLES